MLRFTLNVLILLGVLYLPLAALGFGIVLAARFRAYELIAWGLLFDSLYAAPVSTLLHFQYLGTLLGVVVVLVASFLKQRLVWYPLAQ